MPLNETMNEKGFWSDVDKLESNLLDLNNKNSEDMIKTIEEMERISDMFEF